MTIKNAIYAQSGGVTAVINASACGVIQTARLHSQQIGNVFAAKDGIIGVLQENLFDTSIESDNHIAQLMYTPGGAFGSCRHQLKKPEEFVRLMQVFKAHNVGYFFYNGGGDSQDTANKIAQLSMDTDFPVVCVGIPKTVDNDLPYTDFCPGFGSVAKYVAISTLEAGLDVASMSSSSTKVFILEVMGRHAGWIAAAGGLAKKNLNDPPHLILFPEIPFDESNFLARVAAVVKQSGYCVIVASEGLRDSAGNFLSEAGTKDAFGHSQLGGVAPFLAQCIKQKLNLKYHWAVADYLQRSAAHVASLADVEQAYALGKEAVKLALKGENGVMPILIREPGTPTTWSLDKVVLSEVANQEKKMPRDYISIDGYEITNKCREYLLPLIQGEAYPPYVNGLPDYVKLKNELISKKLDTY